MNSIAGGGTLLTFPALIWIGVEPIIANATSTVALIPGSFSSMWGYREELAGAREWAIWFALPSLAGGIIGALLLIVTPASRFNAIVPWLVLGATALFAVREPVMRAIARRRARTGREHSIERPDGTLARPPFAFLVYQLLVGIYGGYFGAGAGIMMLAALGLMGLVNIHRMNGLKNWGGLVMNLVAAALFVYERFVEWPVALTMAVGSVIGGYAAARGAQRVGQAVVKRAIIVIGVAAGVWLYFAKL